MNINCGGPAIPGYLNDQYYSGVTTVPAPRGSLPPPYDTGRYGASLTYTIPAIPGPHRLMLEWAETAGYGVGQRKFNVDVNSSRWLTNLDVVSQAGPNAPLSKVIDCDAVGGYITVLLSGSATMNAFVNAIHVDPGLTIFDQLLIESQKMNAYLLRMVTGSRY